jgi:collagen beta-1,O-galactosyltransferase
MERGYNKVMVLEDDIRFEPFFRQKVSHIMAETLQLELDWDLV